MSDAYVTLPLGLPNEGDADESNASHAIASAPELPEGGFAPRPPPGRPSAPPAPESQDPSSMMSVGTAARFEVHIADPQKQGSGMNAFVSYNVTTFTSLDQYQSAETTVTRRYNHFVWLHTTLEEQYPCYFIPSLPEKTGIVPLFNRFQDDFVEGRRIALEQYIARLVRHPAIQTSKPLQIFLEGDEGLMRLPEEKKPSLLGSLMGGLAATPKPPHVPDEEFDAMRNYVKDFEVQLAELHKFLERLVRRRKDLASSLAELGLTLITLAGHEQQSGDPDSQGASKACTDLGSCCDHLSISLQHQANDEAKKALMVVDDWLRVVRGAKQAIKARGLAAGSTVLLRQDVDRKTKILANGAGAKHGITENDVMELSRKVEESQQRCDLLGERVREEMRRMKRSKGSEVRAMLCGFVSVQLKYGSEVQSSWERVLPSLVSGMDPNALNKP